MKVLVSVILFSSVLTALANLQNVRQPKEIAQRRQIISYGNKIVHENPTFPDQSASSSVNVNFNPQPVETRKQVYQQYPQEYPQEYTQNYPTSAPQSQLFNVGYSVSFTNGNKPVLPKIPPKYTRNRNLDEGEIITGTRKRNEEVEIPALNMSPQEYVSAALISTKKQKLSGIKPKSQLVSYSNPKILLTQANLSPATQKYYKALEQLKPQVQNTQELQQKYSWRNLSPSVEIIRSTEIPIAQKYPPPEPVNFDHARALGRSQEFDYTNGIDNNAPQQNAFFYVRKSQPQAEKTQTVPVVVNQNGQKIAIDTSLLREAVSIPVDTRYAEEQIRNQMAYNSIPKEQPVQDVNYLQQNYRTIPVEENAQIKPVQVIYRQEQPQGFQDYQSEDSRFQFKIYGKPQPVATSFKDSHEEPVKRQPRFLSDLHTNLRPPPFDLSYQRRFRVY